MLFSLLHKRLQWMKTPQMHINNLAWLYASQGEQLKRAVELAERAVALDVNAARLDTLAYVYYRREAYSEAKQAILPRN